MSTSDSQETRPTRDQRLAALAEAHYQWSLRVEAKGTASPVTDAEWHPTVSDDPEDEEEFLNTAQRIMNGEC